MTDKERIFTYLLSNMYGLQLNAAKWGSEHFKDMVHFAPWDTPRPGDLVLGLTGSTSKWKIGIYISSMPDGALIRDIGTKDTCNYTNEMFIPIKGLSPTCCLEGEKYKFYIKVLKAFHKGGLYLYRFGGIIFDGKKVTISIREAFGRIKYASKPFDIEMTWDKKTSIKKILETMRKGGYGTYIFQKDESLKQEE